MSTEAMKLALDDLISEYCMENSSFTKRVADIFKETLAQPQQEPYTYASTQATMCAGCGEHKHTPLRIDAMGGYVCLTCIDQKLGSLLGEFGYPEPEQPAQPQQEPVAWMHKIDCDRDNRDDFMAYYKRTPGYCIPLYTSPQPPAQELVCSTGLCHYRKPLTNLEELELACKHHWLNNPSLLDAYILGIRDAEAAHGIKGDA